MMAPMPLFFRMRLDFLLQNVIKFKLTVFSESSLLHFDSSRLSESKSELNLKVTEKSVVENSKIKKQKLKNKK